jgi:ElaB/YqjD/DUF883 family membrane-anchored ribosome-binding protein
MKLKRDAGRTTEEIAGDFGQLVEEGRALLSEVLQKPTGKVKGIRDTFADVGERLSEFQSSATRAARQGAKQGARYARQADDYVRENPWPAIAGGIILGVLATLWWNQRR